ncbi:S9 family peptidase [Vallicoccus soli]|uniref:S9 family peptidase n=1 Tax=Vallicoccus soli TaxID=2339232 RepID=A0A3A3Z7Q1_9ACTN|nr:prolyl oligopeptidase family serine peptidase [Vallicoccus soli]RJK96867.1 S9 family peptidase [Vallicoccus soli]
MSVVTPGSPGPAPQPCGTWSTPVSAALASGSTVRLEGVAWDDDGSLWWSEGRADGGGRAVVLRRGADGSVREVTPPGLDPRTRAHEYGGGAWVPVGGRLVLAGWADQRLHLVEPDGAVRALTPEPVRPQGVRYADLVPSPDRAEVWCVREEVDGADVRRAIVAVPLDGGGERVLAADGHFLSTPRPSPDGRRLAWLRWDHPRLPWDGTELRVADVAPDGSVGTARTVLGGASESVFQPEWLAPDRLVAVSDRSGWWNLHEVGLDGAVRALCPREEEFGVPQWQFGMTTYAVLDDGRLAVTHGTAEWALSVLDPADGSLRRVDLPQTDWRASVRARGGHVAAVAGGPATPAEVLDVDLATGRAEVVARALAEVPDERYLPRPHPLTVTGPQGREVHAVVYPPRNPGAVPLPGERPPYVAFVHGGPTAQVRAGLDLVKAAFTSRGIGVVDVNYGGSTGYGRAYRERLRGQWGVVDVEDVVAVVQALAERGEADGERLLVRGGSAGGWTVLAALTRTSAFAGGTSYFGVAELVHFVEDTHDFESRYVDGLVGPLPEAQDLYVERAPLSHVDGLSCPVLLLQGLDDRVVPPSQAEMLRDALRRKGIPHAYVAFEGEQHGFRSAAAQRASLEAELSFTGQVCGVVVPDVPALALER